MWVGGVLSGDLVFGQISINCSYHGNKNGQNVVPGIGTSLLIRTSSNMGLQDRHKISDEFDFGPHGIIHFRVTHT